MSSVVGQVKHNNIMMDAIVTAKKQEDQKAQIENRIIKLRREEEKANKRIRDLQRRQKFVAEMNDEKSARFDSKRNNFNFLKETEENNRRKFNEGRVNSQTRVMQSMERTFQQNRGTYMDLKNQ